MYSLLANKTLIFFLISWNFYWRWLSNAFVPTPRARTSTCTLAFSLVTSKNGQIYRREKSGVESGIDTCTATYTTRSNLITENDDNAEDYQEDTFDYQLDPISDASHSGDTFLNGKDFPSDEELDRLPRGQKGGVNVIRHYEFPATRNNIPSENDNIPLQEALCLLDPDNYPSPTRARKACRKGSVLIHRGPIDDKIGHLNAFNSKKCCRGRVGDKIFPGDIIGIQVMMGTFKKKRCYPFITYSRPRFSLPVLYEDDHMAIVDKPAGISMYGHRRSRSGSTSRRTVRDVLPFCLTPPAKGTPGKALRRPMAVHRLDTPTSGLLVVAKTKLALDSLYRQFEERRVIKTYTAIVNGIPQNCEAVQTSSDLIALTDDKHWNIVDYPLGGKHAITTWRVLESAQSLNAKDEILTLVEVQPRTGRYHQIRRHFAWICRRPLVGDALYAGALQAPRFRRNGLYLCSNAITLDHPYYKILDWERMASLDIDTLSKQMIQLSNEKGVQVTVRKELPKRFAKLLKGEQAWRKQVQSLRQ